MKLFALLALVAAAHAQTTCTGDLVWTDCGTPCENACGEAAADFCITSCVAGCQCPSGQWLVARGGDECVDEDSCPADTAAPTPRPTCEDHAEHHGEHGDGAAADATSAPAPQPTAALTTAEHAADAADATAADAKDDAEPSEARSVLALRRARCAIVLVAAAFVVVAGVLLARRFCRRAPVADRSAVGEQPTKGLLAVAEKRAVALGTPINLAEGKPNVAEV